VKTEDHAVAAGHSLDPARWQEAFECLMARIAGRFARVEPRRRGRRLVLGLLSDLPRKNCWTIAEWAGETTPDGNGHERAKRQAIKAGTGFTELSNGFASCDDPAGLQGNGVWGLPLDGGLRADRPVRRGVWRRH
jgi:hypothetical protein